MDNLKVSKVQGKRYLTSHPGCELYSESYYNQSTIDKHTNAWGEKKTPNFKLK